MKERYYNEKGEVGVIVCTGYGAGWSTWEEGSPFDPDIIEAILDNVSKEELEKLAKRKYPEAYTGGLTDGVRIEFLPKGTKFIIDEYDGSESIQTMNDIKWLEA